jgi:Ca-activated chloride channel homolog
MLVSRFIKRICLSSLLAAVVLSGSVLPSAAQDPTVRSDAGLNAPQQQPSPTPQKPKAKEEETLPSDDVVRVETNLTNFLFTAEDKHKRFISTLKAEDIRIYEDGKLQEVFTFQQNTDLPLSLAILIDCSASEERTLPEEKSAAREFLETVLRPNKDEAAIVTFTGEVTLEQGLTSSLDRLRRAVDKVEFVPPSGYIGGGVVVAGTPPISGTNQELASRQSTREGR